MARPKLQIRQAVKLASHVRAVPAYDGKPALGHDAPITVSAIAGNNTKTNYWRVTVTDGVSFWTFQPDDLEVC